jgi:GH24 family phage-related lysozyme (muramidase)
LALRYCPVLTTEPDGRLAAIVDFTFNLGAGRLQASTVRRRVNQRDWAGAAQELRRWVYGGGRSDLLIDSSLNKRSRRLKILNLSSKHNP